MARLGSKYNIVKTLLTAVFICLLAVGPVLAQRTPRARRGALEASPTRPDPSYRPLPWLMAFVLLGLACYPAFKNSKRELSD